jgi:hypothetical protein
MEGSLFDSELGNVVPALLEGKTLQIARQLPHLKTILQWLESPHRTTIPHTDPAFMSDAAYLGLELVSIGVLLTSSSFMLSRRMIEEEHAYCYRQYECAPCLYTLSLPAHTTNRLLIVLDCLHLDDVTRQNRRLHLLRPWL